MGLENMTSSVTGESTITLGERDAAIVFKDEGRIEVQFPNQHGDDKIYQSSYAMALCLVFLNNQELMEKAQDIYNQQAEGQAEGASVN